MNLLINGSNLTKGGGIQVGISFVNELLEINNDIFYCLVLSKEIYNQLNVEEFPENKFKIIKVDLKKGFKYFFKNRSILSEIEKGNNPDVVFTIFGHSIWKPKVKHLVGFAIPYIIYEDSPFFSIISSKDYFKFKGINFFKKIFFKINSDFIQTETDDARQKIEEILGFKGKVFTVSNTLNQAYYNAEKISLLDKNDDTFDLLTVTAFYPHKNLLIIKKVIDELNNRNVKFNFKFHLTIDNDSYNKHFIGYENFIINHGPTNVAECYKLYNKADVMFLPTLLECFSASYVEAMYMERPILTSNLSFSKTVCKAAALYVDALNPVDIADKIVQLKENESLRNDLINKGRQVFESIPSSRERAKEYLKIIESIYEN